MIMAIRMRLFLTRLLPSRWFSRSKSDSAKKGSFRQVLPGLATKRTLGQWKELRRNTATDVKQRLASSQPIPAIKKLILALLEDPQHQPYHDLLKRAVELRRQRRLKEGSSDPWQNFPDDLREEALQIEAFSAYVEELEHLFDKLGVPQLQAPPPAEKRLAKSDSA